MIGDGAGSEIGLGEGVVPVGGRESGTGVKPGVGNGVGAGTGVVGETGDGVTPGDLSKGEAGSFRPPDDGGSAPSFDAGLVPGSPPPHEASSKPAVITALHCGHMASSNFTIEFA